MRLPTFFILGAPKCGTTALAQYVSAHPDVVLSSPKEPHFFDAGYARGLDAYMRDHFGAWSGQQAAGEATPSYLAIPYAVERIRRDVPDAKLIAVLRHPVERAFSSWWMLHARGMEALDFPAAIAADHAALSRGSVLDGPEADAEAAWIAQVDAIRKGAPLPVRTYLRTGHYATHLERLFALFGRERVRVILTDDLRDDAAAVVRDTWTFLGVDAQAPLPDLSGVNEAVGGDAVAVLRAAQSAGLMRVRGLVPAGVKRWLKRRLARMGSTPTMDPAARSDLVRYFGPHVDALETLLGVDLDAWRR